MKSWTVPLVLTALTGIAVGKEAGCYWNNAVRGKEIAGFDDKFIPGASVEECKTACETEKKFKCRSFDAVVSGSGHGCHLSSVDRYNVPIVHSKTRDFYEIICTDDQRSLLKCPLIGPISDWATTGHNLIVLFDLTVEECYVKCRKETTFHCKSFDYHRVLHHCLLAIVNRENVPLDNWKGYEYYEISCETPDCPRGKWNGPTRNMHISGNDLKTMKGSVEQCKTACRKETFFKCRSIDYDIAKKECHMQMVTSSAVPLVSQTGFDFYELSHCDGIPPATIRPDMCQCYGHPHCVSFDGTFHHFAGTCKYLLSRDNCVDGKPAGDPTWEVIINNERDYENETMAHVQDVQVLLHQYELKIDILAGRRVVINDKPVRGFPQPLHNDVSVIVDSSNVMVVVNRGILVSFDGAGQLSVQIPELFRSKTCGLCGNANKIPGDDWTIGKSEECMDSFPKAVYGDLTTNPDAFGNSWTSFVEKSDDTCMESCDGPQEQSVCESEEDAKSYCNVLQDENGPFAECIKKLNKYQTKKYFGNCVTDSCLINDNEVVPCDHAQALARTCRRKHKIVVKWRTETFCPLPCGKNMDFKTSGSSCMPTCGDHDASQCGDIDQKSEGCFCKEGFVFDGESGCMPLSECGCKLPDQHNAFINVGESYLKDNCTEICHCEKAGGDLACKTFACRNNTQCVVDHGIEQCECIAPFVQIGRQCTELNNPCDEVDGAKLECFTCRASSDEECVKEGAYKPCGINSICQHIRKWDRSGNLTAVVKRCKPRQHCSHKSLGPDGEECKKGRQATICRNCNYADHEHSFKCLNPVKVNPCSLTYNEGLGDESLVRWAYRPYRKRCMEFIYRGTGGNENNFLTKQVCEEKCYAKLPPECMPEIDEGKCSDGKKTKPVPRYGFVSNSKIHTCKRFKYYGCGGNLNNFKRKSDCMAKCKNRE